jgi:hypothetical protein
VTEPERLQLPFLVEDHFVPSGCFGDANCSSEVLTIDAHGCSDERPSAQGICRRYSYRPLAEGTPGAQGYLGILFQMVDPLHPNQVEIGRVPGRPIAAGARRVTFWARVAGDPVLVSFRAGGANNWGGESNPDLPYKDTFGVPKPVTLTKTFQHVQIDLTGVTYDSVVSPFGWAIEPQGATDPIDLDIDDVRWE